MDSLLPLIILLFAILGVGSNDLVISGLRIKVGLRA